MAPSGTCNLDLIDSIAARVDVSYGTREQRMYEKLSRDALVDLLEIVIRPNGRGFTDQQINKMLYTFCIEPGYGR